MSRLQEVCYNNHAALAELHPQEVSQKNLRNDMEWSQLLDENNLKNWHVHFLLQDSSCSISSMKFEVPWTRWNKSVWSNVHDATGLKAFFLVAINWATNGWCFFPQWRGSLSYRRTTGSHHFWGKCKYLSIDRNVCCLMCATMIFMLPW